MLDARTVLVVENDAMVSGWVKMVLEGSDRPLGICLEQKIELGDLPFLSRGEEVLERGLALGHQLRSPATSTPAPAEIR